MCSLHFLASHTEQPMNKREIRPRPVEGVSNKSDGIPMNPMCVPRTTCAWSSTSQRHSRTPRVWRSSGRRPSDARPCLVRERHRSILWEHPQVRAFPERRADRRLPLRCRRRMTDEISVT
jgi:hypothetical protein